MSAGHITADAEALASFSAWADLTSDSHSVQFYSDDSFLLDTMGRFIGTALGAGDGAVVFATKAHLQGLAQRLKTRGLDVGVALQQGRYVPVEAPGALAKFMRDGVPDERRFRKLVEGAVERARAAVAGEYPRVVVFGELVALLLAEARWEAAVRVEQLWNELVRTHSFSLRCAYPMSAFSTAGHSEPFLKICGEHSHVIPTESYTSLLREEDRLRAVSQLQQKAQALERELAEQKRMEQALRHSEKLAASGRLAAAIAHEINNPLEALTNLFYILQLQPSLDEPARQYAALADKELQRVARITRQLLAFHRESLRPAPMKISEILDDVVELYAPKLASSEISVEKDYESEEAVEGFPSEIRQVLANLVSNAMEACGAQGKIRLHVFAARERRHPFRHGVRVCIADTGSGVRIENRQKIFEPFFTTKGEAGTGLGLWVSRGIVQKHEGSIRFRSSVRPGRSGTVFSVFLPSAAGQAAGSQSSAAENAAQLV